VEDVPRRPLAAERALTGTPGIAGATCASEIPRYDDLAFQVGGDPEGLDEDMADLALGQRSAVGLGFGHTATMVRSQSETLLVIRGPDGCPALEVRVTEQGAVVRRSGSSAPPPGPEVAREPALSVRQYASFRAECITRSDHPADVRERHGLTEAEEAIETDAWRRKFDADPELFELYKRLFQQFRASPERASGSPRPAGISSLLATLASGPSRPGLPASGSLGGAALLPADLPPPTPEVSEKMLSLGQHAALAAGLLSAADREEVYRMHGLGDPVLRKEVLRRCEARLGDPTLLETWKRLYSLALQKHPGPA
jgi:hypothetical protein